MSELQELFSDVTEEEDESVDDWEIPVPEETEDNWQETWLDGIDLSDVDGYDSDIWEEI